ncbi:hypothetical protein AURDEDRAFT_127706 [Auricularia subglabra TFB-10046 SS5]|nr:hypothetical protein AURDEDRAFT_127706 [Auricularia subglabra TFB-10046 SS5]
MGAPLGILWKYYHAGEKQNTAHKKAYCLFCIAKRRPANIPHDVDHVAGIDKEKAKAKEWFKTIVAAMEQESAPGCVLGVKDSMVAHLDGRKACEHAPKVAKKDAKRVRLGIDEEPDTDASEDERTKKRRRTAVQSKVEKLTQLTIKTWKGVDMPFSEAQITEISKEFAHATVSANLAHTWIEDPEVIRLFVLFRSRACDAIPSRRVLSDRLIPEQGQHAEKVLEAAITGKNTTLTTDGWKDAQRNAVAGANVVVAGKSYLVSLQKTTGDAKDGPSMCKAFIKMIDATEERYGCVVVKFLTDNDGGLRAGRNLLKVERPWILVDACLAHQAQLINGDYFKVSKDADWTAEQATDVVGWLHNHGRVRNIFNTIQSEEDSGRAALAYLVGNQTRWTTHTLAFQRLQEIKEPLRKGAIVKRREIVEAQVGAEKNKKRKAALEEAAGLSCDILDDPGFWRRLDVVVDDLEPITYMTNKSQADDARPDDSAVMFGGIFRHFERHNDPTISAGMMKCIEARWKALDQPVYILALVLNPYERLERFGDKANLTQMSLLKELILLYRRVHSCPPKGSPSAEAVQERVDDLERRIKSLSTAFLQYLSNTGPFEDLEDFKQHFRNAQGNDPRAIWAMLRSNNDTKDLADFAQLLLGLASNQAGNERVFSRLLIQQTRLRNRLSLLKLETMTKISAQLRAEHYAANLRDIRAGRQNHDEKRVAQLLAVPR